MREQHLCTCGVNMEIALKIVGETRERFQLCQLNTWFKSHIDNKFCEISGYNVVRPNRTYTERGDGITFYISQGLNYKTAFRSANKSVVEYLGIEISGEMSLPSGQIS
uniref:Uncharacterized protein n=1 Tax=Glossina austeni TaxID=7395 RepID=A0A1A9UT03_GLOAU